MFVMKNMDDLWEHIAYVLGYAPDRFPYRDFIPADQQMTLESAFDLLRQGVMVAYPEPEYEEKRSGIFEVLGQSLAAYRSGDEVRAGHLLNKFEDAIFKRPA